MSHTIDSKYVTDVQLVADETKLRLLQQILASETGALSAVELAARNEVTESTIRDHLRTLQNHDRPLVTVLEPDVDRVTNGIPRNYYAVTERGISLLKDLNMYEEIGMLYDLYSSAELAHPNPDGGGATLAEIAAYEHRPAPDWL